MTKNDDQLIRQFMQANKQEVADKGFSRWVMRRLPLRPKVISDTLSAAGIILSCILFYVFDGLNFIMSTLHECFQQQALNLSSNAVFSTLLPVLAVITFLGIQKACAVAEE